MAIVPDWLGPIAGLIALAALALHGMRRRERIVEAAKRFAISAGMDDVRARGSRWAGLEPATWAGVEATSAGRPVRFQWIPSRRGVPTRIDISIRLSAHIPATVIVRPFDLLIRRLIGPPRVEGLMEPRGAVRSRDAAFARRVVSSRAVREAMLIVFDELRIDRKGVRVTVPVHSPNATDKVVREGWKLADAVAAAITG